MKRENRGPSKPGEKFTNFEVAQIWKEIGLQSWRSQNFYDEFQNKNPHLCTEINWRDNIEKVISKIEDRRIKAQPYHRAALANTFGWELEEFSEALRGKRPSKKTTGTDRAPLPDPFFGEIQIRPWQEIRPSERPYPFPPSGCCSMPPFPPRKGIHYVSGCNIRLRALVRYELKPVIHPDSAWPEIETVLYQGVGRSTADVADVDAFWMRMASFGAVSSGKGPSQITPKGNHWLLTCWGKHRIAGDEPWLPFEPVDFKLDRTGKELTVSFAPLKDRENCASSALSRAGDGARAVLQILADTKE